MAAINALGERLATGDKQVQRLAIFQDNTIDSTRHVLKRLDERPPSNPVTASKI